MSQSSSRTRVQRSARNALAASAAAAALLPSAVHAQEEPHDSIFGGGVFIGYHYGYAQRSHLEWGLEAFGTRVSGGVGCSSDVRHGLGAFAQLAFLGISNPRLTLGGLGGGEVERATLALTGELGLTFRFGSEGGLGIHTGAVADTVFLNAGARYQWLRNEAWLGGGLRVLSPYGLPSMCEQAVGRPLRTDAGLFALQSTAQRACNDNSGQRIEAVGRAFERDAQLEHASVPAFLQLASELARLDAPRALIERALQAARDEVRHTELCLQLAQRHLEDCAPPALPPIVQRAAIAREQSLVRLAIESWLDGCVAEGRAAEHAARAAAAARDPEAKAALTTIARDEHRHSELGWSILQWAIERGGDEARAAVRGLRDCRASDSSTAQAHEGLEAHGLLSEAALQTLAAEHFEASQRRLDAVLA